ncbi:nitroreductase family protein [Burkholderia anthina]|uniref:nitroreductase family protein n=1 Tax=Burkholderia anthina TaxID=179879 RepID=UPI001588E437|nr:nitroreductase family protein [Burkholderia anthina]
MLTDTRSICEEAADHAAPADALPLPFAQRRSIRRYLDVPIARPVLDALIDAAISAPSAHNRQPWRFAVVVERDAKRRVALAMGERLRADRRRDGDADAAIDADVARSHARITGAAALVIVCVTMADMDVYPDDTRNRAEYLMAVQSTAMAGQNLLLAASAAGLGACWLCAPMFCPDTVCGTLGLPRDWQPQGMITLGYPANTGKPFTRRVAQEVSRFF